MSSTCDIENASVVGLAWLEQQRKKIKLSLTKNVLNTRELNTKGSEYLMRNMESTNPPNPSPPRHHNSITFFIITI